jgi:DNA-binding transcriptional ArsR family regulator
MEETRRITEVEEFKAVAHPLRVRMLAALRSDGPATATELARRFATDTGATSYHLRRLARFGFVTEVADPGGHPRSRRWQAVHMTTSWTNTDFAATPEGREVAGFMRHRQLEVLMRDVERFEAQLTELPAEWIDACGMHGDLPVRLTAESVCELFEKFDAELRALAARDADHPAARTVAIYAAGYPR